MLEAVDTGRFCNIGPTCSMMDGGELQKCIFWVLVVPVKT